MAEAERTVEVAGRRVSGADRIVDEVLPDGFDWRRMVTTYPLPSLAVAAIAGYLLARLRGETVVAGVAAVAGETLLGGAEEFLHRD